MLPQIVQTMDIRKEIEMKHSLDKAIKLHDKHMKKPETATRKSQEQMMSMMKKHKEEMKGKVKPKKSVNKGKK